MFRTGWCQSMQGTSSTVGHPTTNEDPSNSSEPSAEIDVDNSGSVLERISRLYAEQLMSDVTLIVGGTSYPCHRLILCATSDVFQVMLMKPEWSECGRSRVELQETLQCATVFAAFLKYFYTGQIAITDAKVIPLLALADKYNVKSLEVICINYMRTHIAHAATHSQLISWLQYTAACGHNDIAQACHNFIKWNLEMVADTADFGNFEPEMLVNLLQQNDIVIHDEMTLYRCVCKWIEVQKMRLSEENLSNEEKVNHEKHLVLTVMSYIRFPMMSPRQLADLLMCPLTIEYKDFFVDRFAIGMSFHSDQQNRIKEVIRNLEEGKLLFQPRLYTSETWSTLLTIENMKALPSYHTSTFMFSSHSTLAEHGGDRLCEWLVDVYPKGVWFRKCQLIVWQGTVEVPESVLRTVRLAITCKDPPNPIQLPGQELICPDMRVKVGILINGWQGGVEHVMTVKERVHHFSVNDRVMNIDDLVPFDELNPLADWIAEQFPKDSHLVGPDRDVLKIHIVISPITDLCSTSFIP